MTTWRAIEAGADLRDRHGRKLKPLGPASLRKLPSMLEAILDDAIALLANNFDVKWVMSQLTSMRCARCASHHAPGGTSPAVEASLPSRR